MAVSIVEALQLKSGQKINVKGWIRSFRGNRFIALNDGSCMASIQIVLDPENFDNKIIDQLNTGASIDVSGDLVESLGSGQKTEIQATSIEIIGKANPEDVQQSILQPKKHSLEFFHHLLYC